MTPLPLQDYTLCRFIAFLAASQLSPQTIYSYLSAIRYLHISNGFPDPHFSSMSQLSYVLKGIKRTPRPVPSSRHRLPITPPILQALRSSSPSDTDNIMLWAACCLAFFGFMRVGEFTCPTVSDFSPRMLARSDITVDSHANPSLITVNLKCSKTDPFGRGVTILLKRTGETLCPVASMLAYFAATTPMEGPLFCFWNGASLSRPCLVFCLCKALRTAGIDSSQHSFRIGAATTAALQGLSEELIKTLGR